MKLVIDGETISNEVDGIAAALDVARYKAAASGRLIVEVHADGQPAGELLDDVPTDTAGVSELGVITADKSAFLSETLHDALDALDATLIHQNQAASQLDQGQVHDALASLQAVIGGWQSVRTVVAQSAALMGIELQDLGVGDTTAGEAITGLADDLVALRDAVNNEDWSALGDVLGYDLKERAESWRPLIKAMIACTKQIGGDTAQETAGS